MTFKTNFLNSEIWMLTFSGAFQRAKIYADNISEQNREQFRAFLIHYVENELYPQYKNKVSEEHHILNIKRLINHAQQKSSILNSGKFRFGVAQKLLNLYLKYHWCLGNIESPPHFPVDRIIQKSLPSPIISWTKMTDEKDYLDIIEKARCLAKKDNISLPEWELKNFLRKE